MKGNRQTLIESIDSFAIELKLLKLKSQQLEKLRWYMDLSERVKLTNNQYKYISFRNDKKETLFDSFAIELKLRSIVQAQITTFGEVKVLC
jgi:hypothetical protein